MQKKAFEKVKHPLHNKSPGEISGTRDMPMHNKINLQQACDQKKKSCGEKHKEILLKLETVHGCSLSPYYSI